MVQNTVFSASADSLTINLTEGSTKARLCRREKDNIRTRQKNKTKAVAWPGGFFVLIDYLLIMISLDWHVASLKHDYKIMALVLLLVL